jgi:hypothetical protein
MKVLNRLFIVVTATGLVTMLIPLGRLEGDRIIQIFGAEFSLDLNQQA